MSYGRELSKAMVWRGLLKRLNSTTITTWAFFTMCAGPYLPRLVLCGVMIPDLVKSSLSAALGPLFKCTSKPILVLVRIGLLLQPYVFEGTTLSSLHLLSQVLLLSPRFLLEDTACLIRFF